MIEFIKGIANGIVSFFTAGVITIAGVILPSPTPTPMPIPISISTSAVREETELNTVILDLPTTTPNSSPTTFLVASAQYSYREKNVDIELSMPENGGELTGSAKGLCNGTIEGIYQKEKGEITGTII